LEPEGEGGGEGENAFQHGVASGDPLADAVILWTRVTPRDPDSSAPIAVEWRVASDPDMTQVVASGSQRATAERDYTVKVDVDGLRPGAVYYYDFSAPGARSSVGRTKTLPLDAARARLAVASCANYPAGYFSAYRLMAARSDLDLVLHLGDYLYEYGNGSFGDGTAIARVPEPDAELITLSDYRARHAQYKADPDLRELHRQHPFVAIWDDHEISNNGYRDGAGNHQPESEGDWTERKRNAMRAYFEWMPIRESLPGDTSRIYRQFAFGQLFDLILLDTRYAGRDPRVLANCDRPGIEDPARSLLGAEQEAWFFDALRASKQRGARWHLVGQQVMMGQLSDLSLGCVTHADQWDGYADSRTRFFELLREEALGNVVVLTGDAHSSWALDLTEDPFDAERYDATTGAGSLAVELVAPSISSPFTDLGTERPETHPHLKFVDTLRHGYLLVDVTEERVQAEWYLLGDVRTLETDEALAAMFEARTGDNHLRVASQASVPPEGTAPPAP
jgi:alkaline phosphatase D